MNAVLVPPQPKIYHIVHVDRLPSIVADGFLWCDAEIVRRAPPGTTIGMNGIKQRRGAGKGDPQGGGDKQNTGNQ